MISGRAVGAVASTAPCAGGNSRSESTTATVSSARIRRQRRGHPAAAAADVVGVHRLGQHQVGVRVEPPAELAAVVVEVRLHRVPAAAQRSSPSWGARPNRVFSSCARAVGGVRDLPGDRHPGERRLGRRSSRRRGSCGPRGSPRAAATLQAIWSPEKYAQVAIAMQRRDPVRVHRPPTPAPASRPSSRRAPRRTTRCRARSASARLGRHLIADGEPGNRRAPRPAVRRDAWTGRWCPGSRRARWRRPRSTAVGVQRGARADQPVPPARGRLVRARPGRPRASPR